MIDGMKTTFRGIDLSKYASDPREGWREWRQSERPVYDVIHAVLEIVLVAGLGVRFVCHMVGYGIYHESKHDEPPDFDDDMFRYSSIVETLIEPEHWHQEALMRGLTFVAGVLFLLWAASTPAHGTYMANEAISPTMVYWGRLFIAAHLCLDPVLGVAWRVAKSDLRARI